MRLINPTLLSHTVKHFHTLPVLGETVLYRHFMYLIEYFMKSDTDLLHLIDNVQIHLKLHVQYSLFYLPASIIAVDFRMREYIIFRTKDLKDELERALNEMQELKSARDRQATMVCEILKILMSANLSKPLIFSI